MNKSFFFLTNLLFNFYFKFNYKKKKNYNINNNFQNFLNLKILNEKIHFNNLKFFNKFGSYFDQMISIENCEFYDFKTNHDGSVIYSINILLISSCLFENCLTSKCGGSIFCENILKIKKSTFNDCTSNDKGGSIFTLYSNRFSSSFNSFYKSKSISGSTLFSLKNDNLILRYNNISLSISGHLSGSLYLNVNNIILKNLIIQNCQSQTQVPGLIIDCNTFNIEYSLFASLYSHGISKDWGCAVHILSIKENSFLSICSFIHILKNRAFTIYYLGNISIFLLKCCFQENNFTAINSNNFFFDQSSFYNFNCLNYHPLILPGKIGYVPILKFNLNIFKFNNFLIKIIKIVLIPSFLFGLIFYLFFKYFILKLKKKKIKRKKNKFFI